MSKDRELLLRLAQEVKWFAMCSGADACVACVKRIIAELEEAEDPPAMSNDELAEMDREGGARGADHPAGSQRGMAENRIDINGEPLQESGDKAAPEKAWYPCEKPWRERASGSGRPSGLSADTRCRVLTSAERVDRRARPTTYESVPAGYWAWNSDDIVAYLPEAPPEQSEPPRPDGWVVVLENGTRRYFGSEHNARQLAGDTRQCAPVYIGDPPREAPPEPKEAEPDGWVVVSKDGKRFKSVHGKHLNETIHVDVSTDYFRPFWFDPPAKPALGAGEPSDVQVEAVAKRLMVYATGPVNMKNFSRQALKVWREAFSDTTEPEAGA